MRGVCIDSANPAGRPSYTKLKSLGASGFRLEMRDTTEFYTYYQSLQKLNSCLLVGPSTGDVRTIAKMLPHEPDVVIIGNEPDFDGPSSWTMTPIEYIGLYNETAGYFPNSAISVAGMFIKTTEYTENVLAWLKPSPTYVNLHYPNTTQDMIRFAKLRSLIVGEWTYYTGTIKEIVDWNKVIASQSRHSFWFCWSNGMVPEHGLVTAEQRKLHTYTAYKEALQP